MNLIGNNIRRLREERNMLQSELAEKVNVSPATVSSWEVGRTEPKIGKVEEICAVFHCEKSDIVENHSQSDAQARRLLAYYNMLTDRDKLQLINTAKFLSEDSQ